MRGKVTKKKIEEEEEENKLLNERDNGGGPIDVCVCVCACRYYEFVKRNAFKDSSLYCGLPSLSVSFLSLHTAVDMAGDVCKNFHLLPALLLLPIVVSRKRCRLCLSGAYSQKNIYIFFFKDGCVRCELKSSKPFADYTTTTSLYRRLYSPDSGLNAWKAQKNFDVDSAIKASGL